MKREPIYVWMEREKGISKEQWDDMITVAADQYLKEANFSIWTGPKDHMSYTEMLIQDPISADEVGGSVERIIAKALGWTSYESRPDELPELEPEVLRGQ